VEASLTKFNLSAMIKLFKDTNFHGLRGFVATLPAFRGQNSESPFLGVLSIRDYRYAPAQRKS